MASNASAPNHAVFLSDFATSDGRDFRLLLSKFSFIADPPTVVRRDARNWDFGTDFAGLIIFKRVEQNTQVVYPKSANFQAKTEIAAPDAVPCNSQGLNRADLGWSFGAIRKP
jgi:hypothetical protein